jgi:hypothetical protein
MISCNWKYTSFLQRKTITFCYSYQGTPLNWRKYGNLYLTQEADISSRKVNKGLCDQTNPQKFEQSIHLLTYSMEQSPSWKADWFAASQEIPRVLWNLKVPHRTHKRLPGLRYLYSAAVFAFSSYNFTHIIGCIDIHKQLRIFLQTAVRYSP